MPEAPVPTATPTLTNHSRTHPKIDVPERAVNGGLDFKFESDPYKISLHGILTSQDYTDAIITINDYMKPSRSKKIDGVLLATGPLIVPLGVWGVRHRMQTKTRKKLLLEAIQSFNSNNPELLMRWNRKSESCLTIERRPTEVTDIIHQASSSPPIPAGPARSSRNPSSQSRGVVAAQAEIVSEPGMYDSAITPSATAYQVNDASGLV